jgi:hypothetical protein
MVSAVQFIVKDHQMSYHYDEQQSHSSVRINSPRLRIAALEELIYLSLTVESMSKRKLKILLK